MRTVHLPGTRRPTTVIGFGCTGLMGALGRRASLALLESAYDNGIRHFDVAPMYGFGEAESCLGEFLSRHRGDVTITTKFGIAPARNQKLLQFGRRLAQPLLRAMPAFKKRLAGVANIVASTGERVAFTPEEASKSIDASLRNLRTEWIDIWLLHEATVDNLQDEGLLRLLEGYVSSGRIGAFGVGSDASEMDGLLKRKPEYCPVVQTEWSVFSPALSDKGAAFRIHHRALSQNTGKLLQSLIEDPARCSRWSQACDRDLSDRDTLVSLMAKAALLENSNGICLFSSKNDQHIRELVNVANSDASDRAAATLRSLVCTEGLRLHAVSS